MVNFNLIAFFIFMFLIEILKKCSDQSESVFDERKYNGFIQCHLCEVTLVCIKKQFYY